MATLRLVHPRGQEPPRPKGRRRPVCVSLTAEEARHLRVALRNLRRAYGSWECLADVMGVAPGTLKGALYQPPGPGLALRAARAAGMHVETLLSGQLSAAGRCSTCGAMIGARPERRAS